VRHEPTSRVAARRPRLHPRLSLRRREGRLGLLRATARRKGRQQHPRRKHRPCGRADVPHRRARRRCRRAGWRRLADLRGHERGGGRPGPPWPRGTALPGESPSGRRDVAWPEHDQAECTTGSDRATDARSKPHRPLGDALRRCSGRRGAPRGSRIDGLATESECQERFADSVKAAGLEHACVDEPA
jgi:hypothetical protein